MIANFPVADAAWLARSYQRVCIYGGMGLHNAIANILNTAVYMILTSKQRIYRAGSERMLVGAQLSIYLCSFFQRIKKHSPCA
jgi:hypothetical protein